jgi:hypothetical protein
MSRYLRRRTALETVKDALAIYARNFLPILSVFLLTLPFSVLRDYVAEKKYESAVLEELLNATVISASWLVSVFLVLIVVTVMVSNICRGNKPSPRLALSWANQRMFWRMLATYAVIFCALMLGVYVLQVVIFSSLVWWLRYLLFLVVLSLVLAFYARVMFVPCVMALERASDFEAFERSKLLGRDFYLRNALLVILTVAASVAAYLVVYLIQFFALDENALSVPENLGMTLVEPVGGICTVLLYYEMRVRKEGFDQQAMSEELNFGRISPVEG